MKKCKSLFLVFALLCALLSGCGGGQTSAPSDSNASGGGAASGGESSGSSASSGNKFDISLGTAGTTGTYYVVGAAMANAINNANPNLTVVAQATSGALENINLIMAGDMQMGFSNADGNYWSCYGGGTGFYSAYSEPSNIRGVMRLYESQGHMVTMANSSIETYEDLRGKTVNLGPPSSTIPAMSIAILEGYGIDTEKDITAVYYSIAEGLEKLTDGTIDASFFVASAPTSGLTSAAATSSLKFVDADPSILEKVIEKYPYFVLCQTKEGAYPSLNTVNTLKIYTEIVTSADVPDEAVYEFVKAALESQPSYAEAHVSCQEIVPETACQPSAEMHPGAAQYFREAGLIS